MFYKKLTFFLALFLTFSFVFAGVSDYAYILKVDSYSVYPTTVYPNSEVSLNITLENISSLSDAKDVVVKLEPSSDLFEVIKESDFLPVVKFSQTATGVIRFKIKPNTPGGYYSIPFSIEYTRDGKKETIETQASINVSNYSKINVILDNYPKTNLYLDETFSVVGRVKNEGNSTLNGVSVKLNFSGRLILLTEGSLFLGDISPTESVSFKFDVKVPKTADVGIYDVNVLALDVSSNTDYEPLSFIVEDVPTIIISSIDKSISNDKSFLSPGDSFSFSVQLENISESRAKSVYVKILNLDELLFEGTDIAYVGSIDADDSGSGVFDLSVLKDSELGNKHVKLQIIYADEYGVERTMDKEVSLLLVKGESSSFFSYILLIIILGGIGYYFYKRKQRMKKIKSL